MVGQGERGSNFVKHNFQPIQLLCKMLHLVKNFGLILCGSPDNGVPDLLLSQIQTMKCTDKY